MDQEILLESQIEDAGDLVSELLTAGIAIEVAFWAKKSDGGAWTLFLGVPSLDRAALVEIIQAIFAILDRLTPNSIRFSDIQLIDSKDPLAKGAIEVLKRSPAGQVTRYRGRSIGDLKIDDAYLLPRIDGPLTDVEVAKAAFKLMARSGILAPSVVALKDGTKLQGTVHGIQHTSADGFKIVWYDVNTGADRTIPASEVTSIWMTPPIANASKEGVTP